MTRPAIVSTAALGWSLISCGSSEDPGQTVDSPPEQVDTVADTDLDTPTSDTTDSHPPLEDTPTDTVGDSDTPDTVVGDTVTPDLPGGLTSCGFQLPCGEVIQAGATLVHEVDLAHYNDLDEARIQAAFQPVADYEAGVPAVFVEQSLDAQRAHGILQVPNTPGEWAVQFRARGSEADSWHTCFNMTASYPVCLARWPGLLAFNGTWVEIVDHPVDTDAPAPVDTDPPAPVDTDDTDLAMDSGVCLPDTADTDCR